MRVVGKRFTILYFLDYGKGFGGAANTLIQQAILMKQAGNNVVVFFSDYFGTGMNEEYQELCRNLEVKFEWETYQITSQPEDIDIVCIDRNYERLKAKIILYKPDILHSVQINTCVELISRELKIPHIMNVYPIIPDFFRIDYLNIFPHYHLCDSWYYARQWQHYVHTDSQCIRTAVNLKGQRKRLTADQTLRFICVGAVYRGKNQMSVIKAFHRALQHGIQGRLSLCGYAEGDYGEECIRYIEEKDLRKDVNIKGFCADMYKEYQKNDILICGSKRESYPNAISEALANGLVIISTPVGGVPEVIEDGRNGYLTRDYSEDALYEKIVQVSNDIKSRKIEKILDNAEDTFLKNHSPQTIKTQLMQYYQYVVKDYRVESDAENNEGIVTVDDIRSIFKPYIQCFDDNRHRFTDTNKILQKLWYLHHIKGEIDSALVRRSNFFIWGTGKYGTVVKEMIEVFLPKVHLSGFIDSKKVGKFLECKVYHPDEVLRRDNVVIFVAVANGQNEVIEKLESENFLCNRDYFILSVRKW